MDESAGELRVLLQARACLECRDLLLVVSGIAAWLPEAVISGTLRCSFDGLQPVSRKRAGLG